MIRSLPINLTQEQRDSMFNRFPISVHPSDRDCINSGAYRDHAGHSRVSVGGKVGMLHRNVYAAAVGPVPENTLVLHKCGNAWCINPNHLYLGDAKQNTADRREHGRGQDGEKNMKAKLTRTQAYEILVAQGRQIDIALAYGVSQATVSKIKLGQTWTG